MTGPDGKENSILRGYMKKTQFDATVYKNQWVAENKDRINLVVPKGLKERIKQAAAPNSINSFIINAINDKLKTGNN